MSEKRYGFGNSEIRGQLLETLLLGAFAQQPIFALGAAFQEIRKGAQTKFKAFQVQKISDAEYAKRLSTARSQESQFLDFSGAQAGLRTNADVPATQRTYAFLGLLCGHQRQHGPARAEPHKRVQFANAPRQTSQAFLDFPAPAKRVPKTGRRRLSASHGPPHKWDRQ